MFCIFIELLILRSKPCQHSNRADSKISYDINKNELFGIFL
jgi:hypothetical protein